MAIAIRASELPPPQVGQRYSVTRQYGDVVSVEYVCIVTKVYPDGRFDLSDPVDWLSIVTTPQETPSP